MDIDKIYRGDALTLLREHPGDSIDLLVTDPPYQLSSITRRFSGESVERWDDKAKDAYFRAAKGFMGKEWDVLPYKSCFAWWLVGLQSGQSSGCLPFLYQSPWQVRHYRFSLFVPAFSLNL